MIFHHRLQSCHNLTPLRASSTDGEPYDLVLCNHNGAKRNFTFTDERARLYVRQQIQRVRSPIHPMTDTWHSRMVKNFKQSLFDLSMSMANFERRCRACRGCHAHGC